jgi:thiol-disulfide isomerase/thioredoxin
MPKWLMRKGVWILLSAFLVLAWVGHSHYRELQSDPPAPVKTLGVGDTLTANLAVEKIGGGNINLRDLSGKTVLINFWAGWCAPCLKEMPSIYSLYQRLHANGLEVLALSMDDTPAEGAKTLRQFTGEPPFPLFVGLDSPLAERFPLEGLPYTVILDKNGKIHYARAGEVDWNHPDAVSMIESLL